MNLKTVKVIRLSKHIIKSRELRILGEKVERMNFLQLSQIDQVSTEEITLIRVFSNMQ